METRTYFEKARGAVWNIHVSQGMTFVRDLEVSDVNLG